MATQELVVTGEQSSFALLRMDPQELKDLVAENLGGDSISIRDLDRVRVPAGAGTTWEVPTIEGDKAEKAISGVIISRATRRAYWPKKYDGANDPPECASDDGLQGFGDPGGSCAECPYNEFGSAEDGVSKACKETRQLFVLTSDSLLPFVVTVPPGSLANVKAYFMRLMRAQLRVTDVVTEITLEKAKSKGGIDFAKVVLKAGPRLDDAAAVRIREFAAQIEPAMQRAARVDRSEVEESENDR